jgi:hypothetical protein
MTSRTTNLGALTPFARRWEVPSYSLDPLDPTRNGKPLQAAASLSTFCGLPSRAAQLRR